MLERERTLKEVLTALETLDKTYFDKQKEVNASDNWPETRRLQLIRDGIKHSTALVKRMLEHKIEVF